MNISYLFYYDEAILSIGKRFKRLKLCILIKKLFCEVLEEYLYLGEEGIVNIPHNYLVFFVVLKFFS